MARSVRAENKVSFNTYIDKDLKAKFKMIATCNKDNMTDIVVQAIQKYIKENESTLQVK